MASVTGVKFFTSPATVMPTGPVFACLPWPGLFGLLLGLSTLRRAAAGHGADRYGGVAGERRVAGRRAVLLENESRDVGVGFRAEAAALARRHGGLDEGDQIARGAGAPVAHELEARQLHRVVLPRRVGAVAGRATGLVLSMKRPSGIESSARRSISSARPRFHVVSSVNTTPPISSGNQPPAGTLSEFDARNEQVDEEQRHRDRQPRRAGSSPRCAASPRRSARSRSAWRASRRCRRRRRGCRSS